MTPFLSDDVAAERAAAKSFGAPILIAKGEVRGVSSATDSITTGRERVQQLWRVAPLPARKGGNRGRPADMVFSRLVPR